MYSSFVTNIAGCIESATQLMNGNLQLVYYSHIPVAVIAFLIGFFVILKNRNNLSARVMFFLSMLFVLWTISNLFSWISPSSVTVLFAWSMFGLTTTLLFMSCLYLVYVYKSNKDMPMQYKIVLGVLLLPIIILTPTIYNMGDFNYSYCYPVDNTYGGYIFYVQFAIAILTILVAIRRYITSEPQKRHEIILISLAVIGFLLSVFGTGYIADSLERYDIEVYGVFAIPLFLAFIAYLIVKFKAFNIKMMGAQALVWALVILIGSEFLFVESLTNQVLVAFTLIISTILGLILVRSVKKEVAQREKIELLATDLKKANSRLTELDIQKSEFVSFATHQLRAPLTAMKGYASLVLEGDTGPVSDEVKNAVTRIYDSSKTLASIVDDYLNITRIELGTMKYAFDNVDLKAMVEDVIAELKPNISASKAKFEFTAQNSGTDYRITADRDKLKQVIANLIDNSIKYTPTGNIRVSLSRDMKNAKLIFEVKDNGIGIAKETLPQLFAKFTRAGNANKTNIKGTGLGLYVAKEIVNSHHGKIYAESEGEGKGSRFVVELDPLSKL